MDVGRSWRAGAAFGAFVLVLASCGNSRDANDRDSTIPRITSNSTTSTSTPDVSDATTAFVPTTAPTTSPPPTNAEPSSTQPRQTQPPPTNAPPPATTGGPTSTVVVTPGPPPTCSADGIGIDTGHYNITEVVCHAGWATGRIDPCTPDMPDCLGIDVFHVTEGGWVHDGYVSDFCAEDLVDAGMSTYTAMAFGPQPCEGDPGASPVIRPGTSGDRVTHLQIALVGLGYELSVDGMYGPRTQAAVRDFQSRNGLEVDGITGPRTQAALGIGPDGGTATPENTLPPSSTSPGPTTTGVVRPAEPVNCTAETIAADVGGTIDEIYRCQAGWAIGLIEACPANTICEHVDVFHVTENGWVHDGVTDGLCAEGLVEGGIPAHTAEDLATYCGETPPVRTNILPGSTGVPVTQVQIALIALGYPIAADGTYGPNTEAAVRDFQAARGLEVDGIAGPNTQAALGL